MFVMFPRLCQNLRLCNIFRQIWTIRGSDTEVYPFSKFWRPLFWIFIIRHFYPLDLLHRRVILPPHCKFHLNGTTCSWVIVKNWFSMAASIRHLNLRISDFLSLSAAFVKICVCIPDFVKFGPFAAEIWIYNHFQNGDRPPCWIFKIGHFHQHVNSNSYACDYASDLEISS